MSVVGHDAGFMQTWADGTTSSVAYTETWQIPAYVWGKSTLQSHLEYQDDSQADTYASSFVQDGAPHNGYWPVIKAPNVTSITYHLHAKNCHARAVWDTTFWN